MQDLKKTLQDSIDEAEWDWLMPHAKRQAVIVVSAQLDLLDVGVAIAQDNVAVVQGWIDSQLVQKPSSEQLSRWNDNPTQRFRSIIVQPYVVVQELCAGEDADAWMN